MPARTSNPPDAPPPAARRPGAVARRPRIAGGIPAPALWDGEALALVQLSGIVQRAFADVAERHDLTPVQGRLLCVLAQNPRGMADLARTFGVERAAMTGLVDRAERRGLVERVPVPGDRRAMNVTLTDHGTRAAGAFHADVTAHLLHLLDPLPPGDRHHLNATVTRIADAAGITTDWGPCRDC